MSNEHCRAMPDHVDCGDNSCLCVPPEERGGMRTNGGCRCFREGNFLSLSTAERFRVRRAVTYWRQRALNAERRALPSRCALIAILDGAGCMCSDEAADLILALLRGAEERAMKAKPTS